MAILVTSKYEEDLIKIEGARVATRLNIDFSNRVVHSWRTTTYNLLDNWGYKYSQLKSNLGPGGLEDKKALLSLCYLFI